MGRKEIKHLSKAELVEIIRRMQQREQELIAEKEHFEALANDRLTKIQNAGTLAEAALAVNGVFEAAQKAADEYVEAVMADANARAAEIIANAQKNADGDSK